MIGCGDGEIREGDVDGYDETGGGKSLLVRIYENDHYGCRCHCRV